MGTATLPGAGRFGRSRLGGLPPHSSDTTNKTQDGGRGTPTTVAGRNTRSERVDPSRTAWGSPGVAASLQRGPAGARGTFTPAKSAEWLEPGEGGGAYGRRRRVAAFAPGNEENLYEADFCTPVPSKLFGRPAKSVVSGFKASAYCVGGRGEDDRIAGRAGECSPSPAPRPAYGGLMSPMTPWSASSPHREVAAGSMTPATPGHSGPRPRAERVPGTEQQRKVGSALPAIEGGRAGRRQVAQGGTPGKTMIQKFAAMERRRAASEAPRAAAQHWDISQLADTPLRIALARSKSSRSGNKDGEVWAASPSVGVREIVSATKPPVRIRLLPEGYVRGVSEPPLPVSKPWSEELERLRGPAHLELDESLLLAEDADSLDTDRWIADSLKTFEHEMCAPGERGNPNRWLTAVHMRNIFRGAGKIVQNRRNRRAVQALRAWAFFTRVERKRAKWLERDVLRAWSDFSRDCHNLYRILAARMQSSLGPAFKSGLMAKYRKLLSEAEGPSLYHREEHGLYMTVGHVLVLVCRRQIPLRLQSVFFRAWRSHVRKKDDKLLRAHAFFREYRKRQARHALLFLSRWSAIKRTQRAGERLSRFPEPRLQDIEDWLLAKRLRAIALKKAGINATFNRLRRGFQSFCAHAALKNMADRGDDEGLQSIAEAPAGAAGT